MKTKYCNHDIHSSSIKGVSFYLKKYNQTSTVENTTVLTGTSKYGQGRLQFCSNIHPPRRYNPCWVLADSRNRLQPSLSLALILQFPSLHRYTEILRKTTWYPSFPFGKINPRTEVWNRYLLQSRNAEHFRCSECWCFVTRDLVRKQVYIS